MDIVNAASSRAAYYDRDAEGNVIEYNATAAPHGLTVRDSYVVPADRKAILNSVGIEMIRLVVAAPLDSVVMYVNYIPFGGASINILTTQFRYNVVNETLVRDVAPAFVMYPGDEIEIATFDASTGGVVLYYANILFSEFGF